MMSANFQKPSLPSCSATHSLAIAAGFAFGWIDSRGKCRYTHAIWPLLSSTMRFSVGCTTLQYGHWKSEYSIRTNGAAGEPTMWSCADAARSLVAVDGASAAATAAGADWRMLVKTIAPAMITPAMIIEIDGFNSNFVVSDMGLFYPTLE